MVRFIKQEAEEKANEINVSAEEVRVHMLGQETYNWRLLLASSRSLQGINNLHGACVQEFNIQKLQQLDAEKAKIRKEYEKKESSGEAKKKM